MKAFALNIAKQIKPDDSIECIAEIIEQQIESVCGIGFSEPSAAPAPLDWLTDKIEKGKGALVLFWGYYADYDWVVFCQLFGTMMDLPKGWPMYCRDLKQWSDTIGAPKFEGPKGEHNALEDAKWNAKLYEHLRAIADAESKRNV